MKKLFKALGLVLGSALIIGIAAGQGLAKEKVFKVGVVAPLTGPSARAGQEHKGAVTMAFDEVGNKIGDYTVELVWIDSEGNPEKATRSYEEAILRQRIDAGLLNWHSSVAVALMESAARNRVPHFFGLGGTSTINEKYKKDPERYGYWVGKGWPTPYKTTNAYVEVLENAIKDGKWKPAAKKVAIYGEDTDWGRSYGNGMRDQFKDAGWEVVMESYFQATETDFFPLLSKMRDQGATLVAGTVSNPPSQAAFIKQAREVGLKSMLIVDALGETGDWYTLTKEASDYILDNRPMWTTEAGKKFAADFEKKFGFAPGPAAAGLAYDWTKNFIMVAEETLKAEGELNRKTLYKTAMEKVKNGKMVFPGHVVMKNYKYTDASFPDPEAGAEFFAFPVIQYMGGKGYVIYPEYAKQADIIIPDYAK